MKVSILIPAYKAGTYIAAALQSVREQTHADWEVIVVEDGSQDTTEAVVADFARSTPQPVTYRNLGHNYGVGTARNRLLELATGEAVAFLDADDTWEASHLALAVEKLCSGADLVVSGVTTVDLSSGTTRDPIHVPSALVVEPTLTLFEVSAIITSSSVVLRKALAERTGQFDTTLRIGEDRDYWLRCALEGGRFASTDTFTCNYTKHEGSSMARTYLVAECEVRFYEKYRALSEVPRPTRRRLLAKSLISFGRLLRKRDPVRSTACFWRAWHTEPLSPQILLHLAFSRWRTHGVQKIA